MQGQEEKERTGGDFLTTLKLQNSDEIQLSSIS